VYIANEAARRVLTMYKIAQGQYFFNGYDLFNIGLDNVATSQVFIDVLPAYIRSMQVPLQLDEKICCDKSGKLDEMCLNLIKQLGSSYYE
jgi:hypothetical protein